MQNPDKQKNVSIEKEVNFLEGAGLPLALKSKGHDSESYFKGQ